MSDGWEATTLGEVADLIVGRTPPRKDERYWTVDLERPFCTIADMGAIDVLPEREGVTEAAEIEGKAKRVPAGSLLMSFKLTIGRVSDVTITMNGETYTLPNAEKRATEKFSVPFSEQR